MISRWQHNSWAYLSVPEPGAHTTTSINTSAKKDYYRSLAVQTRLVEG
uniref:Uncharacterized protein n=1 Tax=Setaria italica TaxID=4555 RepID=K3XPA4_SETIT